FELDANGLLHVLARDVATGADTKVEIHSAVEVSDEAVEKMLADSLEHAFEDMDDRQFAEACLQAGEMLPAVDTALQRLGAGVGEDERNALAVLVEKVHHAKEARSLHKFKRALNELDKATEPLAARLVEGVMEGKL
ncbi:MAG: Hsp70 family protein, partial [Verrucomicrobiota bacterium]